MNWNQTLNGIKNAWNNNDLTAPLTAAGQGLGKAISGKYKSVAGDITQGLSTVASAIPGVGKIAGPVLGAFSGLVNRAFGSVRNEENIAAVEGVTNSLNNWNSNAGSFDQLASDLSTSPAMMVFDNSFTGANGWLNHKNDRLANRLRVNEMAAFDKFAGGVENVRSNLMQNQYDNADLNFTAYGGPIFQRGSGVMSPFGSRFAFGGPLQAYGADWDNDIRVINAGGTHEENPYQGVQVGVDPEGTPNLVEEGEIIWEDYVFSNRITVPHESYDAFGLREPKKKNKKDQPEITFAEAAENLQKITEERPNDPIALRGQKVMMGRLAELQEQIKQQIEQEKQAQAAQQQQMAEQYAAMQGVNPTQQPMVNQTTFDIGGKINTANNSESAQREMNQIVQDYSQLVKIKWGHVSAQDKAPYVEELKPYFKGNKAEAERWLDKQTSYSTDTINNLRTMTGLSPITITTQPFDPDFTHYGQTPRAATMADIAETIADPSWFIPMKNNIRSNILGSPHVITGFEQPDLSQYRRNLKSMDKKITPKILITSGTTVDEINQALLNLLSAPFQPSLKEKSSKSDKSNKSNKSNKSDTSTSVDTGVTSTDTEDLDKSLAATAAKVYPEPEPYVPLYEENKALLDLPPVMPAPRGGIPNFLTAEDIKNNLAANAALYGFADGGNLYATGRQLLRSSLRKPESVWSTSHPLNLEALSLPVPPQVSAPIINAPTLQFNPFKPVYQDIYGVGYTATGRPVYRSPEEASMSQVVVPWKKKWAQNSLDISRKINTFESPLDRNLRYKAAINSNFRFTKPQGNTTPPPPEFKSVNSWSKNLRYFPIIGAGISAANSLFTDPDYSRAEAIERAGNAIPNATFTPVGNYLAYNPFDTNYYQNQAAAEAAAARRNLIDVAGGSRGQLTAALLGQNYNTLKARGDLAAQSHNYNDNLRRTVAEFNRGTNQFNSSGIAAAIAQNANIAAQRAGYSAKAAELKEGIDQALSNSRSLNLTNFFNSVGDVGRERFIMDMIQNDRSRNYDWEGNYKGMQNLMNAYSTQLEWQQKAFENYLKSLNSKAYGGQLRRKKQKKSK